MIWMFVLVATASTVTFTPKQLEEYNFKRDCNTICKQDGDTKGVVIEGQCGCWNPRDISKIVTRVPTGQGKAIIDNKQKPFFWELQ